MFGYYILAIVCFITIIALTLVLGYSVNKDCRLSAIDTISIIAFVIVLLIFGLTSLRRIYKSEVKTVEQPKIELKITTIVAPNDSVQSDTTYIYKFKQ